MILPLSSSNTTALRCASKSATGQPVAGRSLTPCMTDRAYGRQGQATFRSYLQFESKLDVNPSCTHQQHSSKDAAIIRRRLLRRQPAERAPRPSSEIKRALFEHKGGHLEKAPEPTAEVNIRRAH
eukprot:1376327-Prymnesium_polylepis.2